MKTRRRWFMISFALVALLVVGFGVFYLKRTLHYGSAFSIKNFDARTEAVLAESLRINIMNQVRFKHASLLGGKDWTLYVCFDIPRVEWEGLRKSVALKARNGGELDVPSELALLPWWKIEKERIDSVICDTEGDSAIIALKSEGDWRRVFAYTEGGRAGFPAAMWGLFEEQD